MTQFSAECGTSWNHRFIPPSYLLDSPVGRQLIDEDWNSLEGGASLPGAVDCVIVGGGLSAVTLGAYLFHAGVSFCIIDPAAVLVDRFRSWCRSIDMRVMRSPYDHYCGCHRVFDYTMLDIGKMCESSLEDFERDQLSLATAGQRSVVPVDVFEAHLYHTIKCHGLEGVHCRGKVSKIVGDGSKYKVFTAEGKELDAQYVILSTGEEAIQFGRSVPQIRSWALCSDVTSGVSVPLVIGAGQTAANVASAFLRRDKKVTVALSGDQFQYRCVDSSFEFFQPSGRIAAKNGKSKRFSFPPSVMWEFKERFENACENGRLEYISGVTMNSDVRHPLLSHRGGFPVDYSIFDAIIPCLGLKECASSFLGLDVSEINDFCATRSGVYVMGALARGAIGPAARNIDGHRVAAERIVRHIISRR